MTREEEIINAASEYGCLDKGETLLAFTEGAKWADKNPKRYSQDELCDIQLEMMKQRDKRLIEKACEWLEENIDAYSKVIIAENSIPIVVLTEDFKNAFTKAINN